MALVNERRPQNVYMQSGSWTYTAVRRIALKKTSRCRYQNERTNACLSMGCNHMISYSYNTLSTLSLTYLKVEHSPKLYQLETLSLKVEHRKQVLNGAKTFFWDRKVVIVPNDSQKKKGLPQKYSHRLEGNEWRKLLVVCQLIYCHICAMTVMRSAPRRLLRVL